jgi:hypothetical protein
MNMLREIIGGLLKMFVGDAWLAAGTVAVVLLTGLLLEAGAVRPLTAGAFLFLGCEVVLLVSVVLSGRRHRFR